MIERGLALELWRLTCDFNQYFLFTNKCIYLENKGHDALNATQKLQLCAKYNF